MSKLRSLSKNTVYEFRRIYEFSLILTGNYLAHQSLALL
jgi:hypothetical protein